MTDISPIEGGSNEVAEMTRDVQNFDPALGSYNFGNLGQAVEFAKVMCKAGPMLPDFAQRQPAICLGIIMRATHWGMDPYGLAMEAYQAKPGGPVGYQAKVFTAALQTTLGITLKYRFEGALKPTGKPVKSHKGNEIAKHGWEGDMKCIAYAKVDGELLELETPPYDMIGIKNSPLWHNNPHQQLRYYAARDWVRIYRPGLILGAYSTEEVDEMSRGIRDVTPESPADRLQRITGGKTHDMSAGEPATDAEQAGPEGQAGQADQDDPSEPDNIEAEAAAYMAGQDAALSGEAKLCPHTEGPLAASWVGGYDSVGEQGDAE